MKRLPRDLKEQFTSIAVSFMESNRLPQKEEKALQSDDPNDLVELWDYFLEEWHAAAGDAWNQAIRRLEKQGQIARQRDLEK